MNLSRRLYYELVWRYVRQVPNGKVVTYGQIAQAIPEPTDPNFQQHEISAARLVGCAMSVCPNDVPWHRVLNAQGKVSSWANARKQLQMLEAEGLPVVQGKINLVEHQWHGLNQVDPPKQHQLF